MNTRELHDTHCFLVPRPSLASGHSSTVAFSTQLKNEAATKNIHFSLRSIPAQVPHASVHSEANVSNNHSFPFPSIASSGKHRPSNQKPPNLVLPAGAPISIDHIPTLAREA